MPGHNRSGGTGYRFFTAIIRRQPAAAWASSTGAREVRIAIKTRSQRYCYAILFALCGVASSLAVAGGDMGFVSPSTSSVIGQVTPGFVADLQQQLEVGLRAARPVEFEFIHSVVTRVANGTLPYDMVQSTFLWARKQPERPMIYFQQALTVRAERIGVQL